MPGSGPVASERRGARSGGAGPLVIGFAEEEADAGERRADR